MKNYADIYSFFTLSFIKILRALIFIVLLFLILFLAFKASPIKVPLFLFILFSIFEIFFRFHISKKRPTLSIEENDKKLLLSSFTLKAIKLIKSKNFIKSAIKEPSINFLLEKADIKEEEIKKIDFKKEDLEINAFNLAKSIKGKYVTPADIFSAYLLFCENQTKLLFNKKLKEEEFLQILLWTRSSFPKEEKPKKTTVNFWGEGLAEDWVYGWTIETKKYAIDRTSEILTNNFTPYNQESEYEKTIEALASYKSLLIVGEPGVGKDVLVSRFGFDSFSGSLRGNLYHQRLFQLMIDALLAGTQNQGELEERFEQIIAELAHAGDVIIYIDDFENILGNSTFKLDLSGALIPYLKKGIIRIIATTTPGSFKKFIEPLHELLGSFEIVKMEEPDKNSSAPMLFQKANQLETAKNVSLTYRAILAAIEFGPKYSRNLVLPGAAALLLEDTVDTVLMSGKSKITEDDVLNQVQKETNAPVGEPKGEEKEILLHLEDEIHKKVVDQQEAVSAISEAMRRLRSGLSEDGRPISFLFLGPTGVGKTETAKALSESYFGGENEMIRFDMSEYSGDDAIDKLLGDEGITDKVFEDPSSLILLDEFEKASQNVLNLFLQVLDDGRLTDNKGKTVSFLDCIIIATSNAASEFIREEVEKGTVLDKAFQAKLFEFLQTKGIFKPELLNRFDGVITFKPLGQNEIFQIVQLLLNEVVKKMEEKDITVNFDQTTINKISKEGFDQQFGARPLRRFIQDNIEDLLAQKLLKDEIKRGEKIQVFVDSNNQISFNKLS